ncbi:MAG TPA: CPBP family intramembrane glutamic endopeptidase [Candidatus Limnocylindrales bacterium]|nr:CPBP family intramembrane glutamic endopeptidase [Candidatus Limnocylindrales bacterium]
MTGPAPARDRHPLALALVLYAAYVALHVVLAWDGGVVLRSLVPGIGGWLGPATWAVYAAFTLLVVALTGRWRQVGLLDPPRPGWLRLVAVPFAAGLPFLLFGWNLDAADVVPLLVVGVPLIALNEELMFRGILLDLLGPLGVRRAVTWTAVLFGCSHLVNIVAGAYPPFTAMQVAATTAGGIAFAAIRIRSGSLWPLLVLHAAIDVVAIATLTGPATSSPILLPVLFGWLAANLALWRYGWWVLRTMEGDGEARRHAPAHGGAPAA